MCLNVVSPPEIQTLVHKYHHWQMALRIVDNPYCVVKIDVNDVKIEDLYSHTKSQIFHTYD